MKSNFKKAPLSFLILFIWCSPALKAAGNGTTAGMILLKPLSARPTALGDAFSAGTNDIAALNFNPASLSTLEDSHLSFLYNKGMAEDSRGSVAFGKPFGASAIGLSFSYYNGGKTEYFDGVVDKTVIAKQDIVAGLGFARKMGQLHVGVGGKYLKSELAETASGSTLVGDAGADYSLKSLTLGLAVQNFGPGLKYRSKEEQMPRLMRGGLSWAALKTTTLFLDVPYLLEAKQLEPGVGLEVGAGPIVLRGGYKKGSELQSISFGAGFNLGKMSLDYSYGLVEELDAQHQVSFGMRFGGVEKKGSVNAPELERRVKFETAPETVSAAHQEAVLP